VQALAVLKARYPNNLPTAAHLFGFWSLRNKWSHEVVREWFGLAESPWYGWEAQLEAAGLGIGEEVGLERLSIPSFPDAQEE